MGEWYVLESYSQWKFNNQFSIHCIGSVCAEPAFLWVGLWVGAGNMYKLFFGLFEFVDIYITLTQCHMCN